MAPSGGSDLSLTDLVVLGVVAEAPAHGFAVAKALTPDAQLGQAWTVQRPLVYRAIAHLDTLGLIVAIRTEAGAQGPRRTVYRATRAGRARVARWLEQPVEHPRDARGELMVKFALLARRGRPLAPLARRQLERFTPVTEGLAALAGDAVGPDRVIARWRLESIGAINRTLKAIVADERAVS